MSVGSIGSLDHKAFREDSRSIHIGVNVTGSEFTQLQKRHSEYKDVSFASLDLNRDSIINRQDFKAGKDQGSSNSSGPYDVPTQDIETVGGVNTSSDLKFVTSPAQNGDLEIVVLGSSSSRNGSGAMNPTAMSSQGFELVEVAGDADRKVEVWARQNAGQNTVQIPGDGHDVGFTIHSVDSSHGLRPSDVEASGSTSGSMSGSKDSEFISSISENTSGTTIREIFFDDSVLVNSAGSGDIRHSHHSFGDGDGLASIVYDNGVDFSENLQTTNYAPAGRQSVEMAITFNKS